MSLFLLGIGNLDLGAGNDQERLRTYIAVRRGRKAALPPVGNLGIPGWPAAVLVPTASGGNPGHGLFLIQIGPLVDERTQEVTVMAGGMSEPARAHAGLSAPSTLWPALDLFESRRAFLVRFDVPGVKARHLEVAFMGGLLVVSGARYLAVGPDGERFHRLERPGGSFRRSVALPTAATPEMVEASIEDGVLTVLVPKLAPTTQSRVTVHPMRLGVARLRQPG
jgi:HSP20 family protein